MSERKLLDEIDSLNIQKPVRKPSRQMVLLLLHNCAGFFYYKSMKSGTMLENAVLSIFRCQVGKFLLWRSSWISKWRRWNCILWQTVPEIKMPDPCHWICYWTLRMNFSISRGRTYVMIIAWSKRNVRAVTNMRCQLLSNSKSPLENSVE